VRVAVSGLTVTYDELRAEVGAFLGYGRTWSSMSTAQQAEVDSCINSGLRRFYRPPPVNGRAHQWGFLRPTTTLALAADTYQYALPEHVGDVLGDFTYVTETEVRSPVRKTDETRVRDLRQRQPGATGAPCWAACTPGGSDVGLKGQRFAVTFFPTPDQAYTLAYRYQALPDKLSPIFPHPWGGLHHGETILASCLAVAEEQKDGGGSGVQRATFLEQLAASVELDSTMFRPDVIGYCGDYSDAADGRWGGGGRRRTTGQVTYNGVLYD
jgi:hypothetical protein